MGDPQMTLRSEDITQIALQVAPAVKQLLAQDETPRIQEQLITIQQEIRSNTEAIKLQGEELGRHSSELKRQGDELHLQGVELKRQGDQLHLQGTELKRHGDELVAQRADIGSLGTELRAQRELMETRFAAVDVRFADQRDAFEKRFDAIDRRFNALTWGLGLGVTLLSLLMTVYQFFG